MTGGSFIYLILSVLNCILANELKLDKLEKLISIWYSVEGSAQILKGLLVANGKKSSEGITFASMICF